MAIMKRDTPIMLRGAYFAYPLTIGMDSGTQLKKITDRLDGDEKDRTQITTPREFARKLNYRGSYRNHKAMDFCTLLPKTGSRDSNSL